MRTTLTIEPDVARRLKALMAETGRPMKRVINEALRVGLVRTPPSRGPRFVVRPHSFRFRAGVDQDKLGQLVDELESEDAARRLSK